MIDFESLLEFEECLSQESTSLDNSSILNNLENKIDHLTFKEEEEDQSDFFSTSSTTTSSTNLSTRSSLEEIIASYDITQDEFATCFKCGTNLSVTTTNHKSCCQSTIDRTSTIASNLESLYWTSFIDNPTRTINTLPFYTELVLKQGIPNCIRSHVWQKLFLLNYDSIPKSIKLVYVNFQHSYSLEVSQQIEKDLTRTFPTVGFFQNQTTIDDLSTILNVYANYDLELGYCQGLLFLVGVLYHHLQSCELTFYALTTIMETELELHDIFTAEHMSNTLNLWFYQFSHILKTVDLQLYNHLATCQVNMQTFLFQWWLSFMSSHTADLSIINRVMDLCQFQGWKIGMMKISLGLLIVNKPILMTLESSDEEVVYQHLLNESKWGNVANDLDLFFGDLLFSWSDELFMNPPQPAHNVDLSVASTTKPRVSTPSSSLLNTFKSLSLNLKQKSPVKPSSSTHRSPYTGLSRERSSTTTSNNSGINNSMITSTTSVFSTSTHAPNLNKNSELDSIYSDVSEVSSQQSGNDIKSFTDYLKLPSFGPNIHKRNDTGDNLSGSNSSSSSNSRESLLMNENEALKYLLKQAYATLGKDGVEKEETDTLRSQIEKMVM
ncbi:hypothetical protein CANMA_003860 [Candida margitis]|uniref:uncharacterized protein n=1 Tax=Candida margitis TaxID=1775924 RepID=UPI002225D8A2|nr:uncharacterized protein CANMA_003860 [Candida margitis]KAI5961086.1 hypothetical protein CANMA_003860 [Candida margitis]